MATQPMTKFVADNALYLKAPDSDKLEAVLAWMAERGLIMETCKEGEAIFTKSGKGKSAHTVCIVFTSPTDPAAEATLNQLYPAPKVLTGIKVTDHDVTDEATDMPIAPIQSDELADHMDAVAADATTHAMAAIAATAADAQLPEPAPLGTGTAVSADDVPF